MTAPADLGGALGNEGHDPDQGMTEQAHLPKMIGPEGMTADEAVLEGAVETVQREATDDAEQYAGMPDLIDQEHEDSDDNRDDNAEPE
jgi:hypothetical protein